MSRIYSTEDETIYKFCALALEQVSCFEGELAQVTESIQGLLEKFGPSSAPRIRNVLSQTLSPYLYINEEESDNDDDEDDDNSQLEPM